MIHTRDLCVSYPGAQALRGVSLHVAAGERVALVGANGAGKTSLLLALMGLLPPTAGEARVDGLPVTKENLAQVRRRAGLVFQNPDDQLFMARVLDDVAFGPRNLGLGAQEARARATQALQDRGIAHLAQRAPLRLSGGEKRLAALAAVLAMQPSLLLLDEPTAFLDPRARRALIAALTGLPHTQLIATHDLAFAQAVCARALALRDGELVWQGPVTELLSDEALLDRCGL
ncbi:MAG: energy-coupling factor ABC transporter ATP-binding protein [Oscillospiraceae bacterium]|jgi:cobalt/nickel transport system ATP-binding protein|nr:energy-coupling factor ABC transporter ATP-binding protein [Oscillospiraceae bacterium]